MTMWEKFKAWFSAARREKIYGVALVSVPLLLVAGVIEQAQVEPLLAVIQGTIAGFASVVQLSNLKPAEQARWYVTVGRGLIYGFAGLVGAVLVAFGVFTPEQIDEALVIVGGILTFVASILGVVFLTPDPSDR